MSSVKPKINWHQHHGEVLSHANGFDVISCDYCGFNHAIPLPTTDELATVYQHDYYNQEKPLYLERYQQDLAWWNQVYEQRYSMFAKYLKPSQRSILDIGSGPGYFLLKGKSLNWRTFGIEPSEKAAAFSCQLGLDIFNGFFTAETASTFGNVDVINLSLVLEHIPDPAALLQLAHNQLSTGGLICVIVPNDFNPFQQILSKHNGFPQWWVAPPHHLNYFNFTSLSSLISRCGFDILHKESTFPIDMFLLMGENYIGQDDVGRACHAKRMHFEQSLVASGNEQLLLDLYSSLSQLGIGREIVIYAQKR
ncbi:class I SAM-dependent methyltransferase [Rheinheimera gaetbuli]